MKNNLIKIEQKIIKKRDELNKSIAEKKDKEFIYQKSTELDDLIAEYIHYESK